MAISQDKIKELLGQGLANEVVAGAVGCSPSYISQLLADEEFSAEVTKLRVEHLAKHNRKDNKLDNIEELLIDNLMAAVTNRQIYKPQDVLRTFQVINAARRRGASATNTAAPQGGIVNLTMPQVVIQQFITNGSKEVVSVGNKSLNTISPEKLLGMLKDGTSEANKADYQRLLSRMPSAVTIDRDGNVS